MAKVKNVMIKHYKVPEGYESWLDYWEYNMKKMATRCTKILCLEKENLVGGHVKKIPDDGNIYLTPLCKTHNHYTYTDTYTVPDSNLLQVPDEDLEEEE